jgi:glycosyltransferase involved in cell wall biosynthesis
MREDRFYRLWFDAWLPVEIAVRRISLFHGTSYLLPRAHRARRVVTVYDLAHEKRPEWAGGCSPEFARRARESARRADAVIATSRCTRRDIVEIYGVPEERVAVVYGGVDPAFRPLDDRAAAEAFRRRKGLPERFVLSVLSLSPRKNIPGLLRAFAIFARSSGLPQHLVIAGKSYGADGPLREAAGLGIAGRFRFIDYVRDEELVLLYNAADLFVFPSFYEGFGLPPLEALACGCPVAAARAGSLPEVLGDSARYFDPADDAEMADTIERAIRAGAGGAARSRGIARAAGFTWERAAAETMDLYERLL